MTSKRYKVIKGSESAHCCFEASVVDTTKPVMMGKEPYVVDGVPKYMVICECMDYSDARRIETALNEKVKE